MIKLIIIMFMLNGLYLDPNMIGHARVYLMGVVAMRLSADAVKPFLYAIGLDPITISLILKILALDDSDIYMALASLLFLKIFFY